MTITITIIIVVTFILYRLAAGRPFANVLAAVAITGLFAVLDPSLRDLPVMAYLSAALFMFVGLQIVFPAAEAPIQFRRIGGRIPELRIGRLSMAVVPVGA